MKREEFFIENYLINKLVGKGWQLVNADELERESLEEPLLIPNLIRAIKRINPKVGDDEIKQVLNELKLKTTGIEGIKSILAYYKFGVPVKFEKEKIIDKIRIFDLERIDNNEFIVSRQVIFRGKEPIRTDIILYVNGIPLVNIECKDPSKPSEDWTKAFDDIKDYEQKCPELYKYVQIGVAVESVAKYFPIVPWQKEVEINEWREEPKDSVDSIIEMLSKATLLDIIQNFLFVKEMFGNVTKVIARYMQYRAVNKLFRRVIDNLKGKENKNKGLIWHWQGSGKTLEMVFTANKLFFASELQNPTIFFIVDRDELQDQLYEEFNSLDIGIKPDEPIASVNELKEVLRHDDYRGKRGIFITLVHKFRPEELQDLQSAMAKIAKRKETIMDRENVIALVDEGDRTQYGILAAQMRSILKNSFFFAFTGTPIAKRGRDTYLEFSYPPEENYLDRYFVTESIKDGFTVKIAYQPRLEELHLNRDLLESFLDSEFEELPEVIREKVEEKIGERLDNIKVILEDPNLIRTKAKDIAQHFQENLDGKFKAMVVTASRKACVIYKQELDLLLPKEYSEVVMSYSEDVPLIVSDYFAKLKERFPGLDFERIMKNLRDKFREEENPKILIVTDMLLRGYNAPILQTMYLDKLLKEHRLLQAIARTNRPYKDLKEAGEVIDYVGILKEFERALALYSREDTTGVLYNREEIREEFNYLVEEILTMLKEIPRNYNRETLLNAIEVITTDEKKEKEFVAKYKKMRRVFEFLGADGIKVKRFEDYKWLSIIYDFYLKTVTQKTTEYGDYARRYFDKTISYVHEATEAKEYQKQLPKITFDENYLKVLEEKVKSTKEKAANILFTLNKLVLVDRYRNPIYESLVEKVERLLSLWREKTKEYERIYQEGIKILEETKQLTTRQKELGFSDMEYAMLLTLEEKLGKNDELILDVQKLATLLKSSMFPGWLYQTTAKKEIERAVRRFVRTNRNRYKIGLAEIDEICDKLMKDIKNYGS